jgi:hypothetical protein
MFFFSKSLVLKLFSGSQTIYLWEGFLYKHRGGRRRICKTTRKVGGVCITSLRTSRVRARYRAPTYSLLLFLVALNRL